MGISELLLELCRYGLIRAQSETRSYLSFKTLCLPDKKLCSEKHNIVDAEAKLFLLFLYSRSSGGIVFCQLHGLIVKPLLLFRKAS